MPCEKNRIAFKKKHLLFSIWLGTLAHQNTVTDSKNDGFDRMLDILGLVSCKN